MSQDKPIPEAAPPAVPQWISTQHEMEVSAKPLRTRIVRVKMKNGALRIACATYLHSHVQDAVAGVREHLYWVTLRWLAEYDTRDGRTERFPERLRPTSPLNALQFRVLETALPDGRQWVVARLGPKGQIGADPKGHGVMGYLRALLVEWVADRHPEAIVVRGSLAQVEVLSEPERNLRDLFFTRSGFTLLTTSDGGGSFHAPSIRDLKTTWNADKVTELQPAALADALCVQVEALTLRKQVDALTKDNAGLTRERRAADVMSRVWLAIAVLSFTFGIVLAIQPRLR
jgi:hypothetical protein